jgi:SARP family transcriptional regulator, regulator of embCAB operon
MEIRVLGPLSVSCGSATAVPTAPKPRSVLALLLLQANQTVPVPDLVQELWGTEPPTSALTTLQTYILQLRKRFAGALAIPPATVATTVLVTVPSGYQFRTTTEDFDLPRYLRLASAGQRALVAGDDACAADLLLQAQGLWRGQALSDVPAGPMLLPQLKRLQESRLTTIENCIEARLRLGKHQEVLSELAGLTTEHQLSENLHALLMVALHRNGRRQEALRVFQLLRSAMIETLGLEPARQLHQLQQAILTDDPRLDFAPPGDGRFALLERLSSRAHPRAGERASTFARSSLDIR